MSEEFCHPVGIDLGTSYSCVAVWRDERVEIISNDQGNRITPSFVAFTPEEKLVGEAARNQLSYNSYNTIFGIKRMIGRPFNDPLLQEDIRFWPYDVKVRNGNPIVEVEYLGVLKQFTPEEISAMILLKMKQTAEQKLGKVKDAVITVPAYFNNAQRQATIDAATIAGLNVLRILAEPTAVALAYGMESKRTRPKHVLVYDLGGGTFDVSVLTIIGSEYNVLATAGNTHLGGEDFDNRLVSYFVGEIREKSGEDISSNFKALRKLRKVCERAKRTLSSATRTVVEVDALYNGVDFKSVLTRSKFDELCGDLFEATINSISKALDEVQVAKAWIDEVVMSGGSSRIPKIQQLVSEFFGDKKLNTSINFDEAVARGAAIQASLIKGSHAQRLENTHLVDCTPLPLGLRASGGRFAKIISKNSPLPVTKTRTISTSKDLQQKMLFSIYEGEAVSAEDNVLLGEFVLENIEIAPQGFPQALVTFTVDLNGILHVSAVDRGTGSRREITITNNRNHPPESSQADTPALKRTKTEDYILIE